MRGKPDPFAKIGQEHHARQVGDLFWALDDVNFEVKQGEMLGIIGRNGAGKSTLLKILSQVTSPTSGEIRCEGRIASLLEVGTGFHPELTGRENIYLNGAILGMTKAEIRRKFDEIVDFSECAAFLDTPVKRYSSGMSVRLAFAVAAHLEPEILVVDEVLAVGDVQFQQKCLGKMGDVARGGRTILFVSHNMGAIQSLCTACVFLNAGQIERTGPTRVVTDYYLRSFLPEIVTTSLKSRTDRSGNGALRLTHFSVEEDASRNTMAEVASEDTVDIVLEVRVAAPLPLRGVDVGISVHSEDGRTLFVLYSSYLGCTFSIDESVGSFRCRVSRLPLPPGRYRVGARATVGKDEADYPHDGVGFIDVIAGDFYGSGSAGCGSATDFLVTGDWNTD